MGLPIDDKAKQTDEMVAELARAIAVDSAAGRKTLVVIGSGCSVARELPTMQDIFRWLRDELVKRLKEPAWQNLEHQSFA